MTSIPDTWQTSSLRELADNISYGFTASATSKPIGPRMLRITDIQNGEVDWASVPYCAEGASEGDILRVGDLVIARTGATTGKSFLIRTVPERAVFASYLIRVRASEAIDPEYLYSFLQSNDYWSQIQGVAKGTAQPGANASILSRLTVPLAPIAEQRRIVAKIDSLSAKSRRARDQLDHIPRLVEKYKQAILARAFRGDLTRYLRDGDAPQWSETTPAELFKWASGKNLPAKRQQPGKVPVIGGNGIGGHHDEALIDHPTLVIGRVGAQCGNVHRSDGPAWITDNAIYATAISDAIDLDFAIFFFRVANLNALAGGTGQPYVNQSTLNSLVMALPRLDEQIEIVRLIKAAFRWIERLAIEATSARKLIDHLDQAVLAKAFRGELVPQDPNDEPSSGLLERIRASRQAAPVRSARRNPQDSHGGRPRAAKGKLLKRRGQA